MSDDYQFVSEPPPRAGTRTSKYKEFAAALRARPGEWGVLPRMFTSHSGAGATRSYITSGKMKDFPKGEYDVVVRQKVVYVRYVGDAG